MPSRAVRKRLAQDVGQWVTDGLIGGAEAANLRERWDQPGFGLGQIVRYFGYSGGLFVMTGLLGLVGAMSRSQGVVAFELVAVGGALFYWGIWLSREARRRHELSSRVVLALGYFSGSLGVGVGADASGLSPRVTVLVTGVLCVPFAFAMAYRLRNTFVLVLGLIALFHWAGSWTSMEGQSSYSIEVEDPRGMAAVSLIAAAFAAVHDRVAPGARAAFAHAWGAVALTYLNLSLLILTVDSRHGDAVAWIVVWALAGIGQVVAGARMHSALFTAFGVTAVAVNLFTRYYENFWDGLDAGLFFLIGGAVLFAAGFGFEMLLGRRQPA